MAGYEVNLNFYLYLIIILIPVSCYIVPSNRPLALVSMFSATFNLYYSLGVRARGGAVG